jgi:hypothetical protein
MSAPALKTDPKYGYFPWWPEDGDAWVHPEDVATARAMIPSARVFCRDGTAGELVVMRYGDIAIRVRRTLWQEVEPPTFNIGDWVEVRTRGMQNEARTGVVREMVWDERDQAVRYQIHENGRPIEQLYAEDDLQRVEPPRPSEEIVVREPPEDLDYPPIAT